jgi:exodeoxyribonuclease V alpha subunit
VKGIGPVYARKLVEKFGEKIFDIIEQESARLEDVDGIGPKRRQRIKAAWAEQKVILLILRAKKVRCLLCPHGPGRQTPLRGDRRGGQDHPPNPGSKPGSGRLPKKRLAPRRGRVQR